MAHRGTYDGMGKKPKVGKSVRAGFGARGLTKPKISVKFPFGPGEGKVDANGALVRSTAAGVHGGVKKTEAIPIGGKFPTKVKVGAHSNK